MDQSKQTAELVSTFLPSPIRHMYDESGTLFLNGVQLEPLRSIGFSQNQNQLHWLEHNKLTYLSGNNIVIYNIITGQQSLIPLAQQNIRIFKAFKNAYNQDILTIIHSNENSHLIVSTFNSWKSKKDSVVLETLEKQQQIKDINYLMQSNQLIIHSIDSVNINKISRIDLKKDKPNVRTIIIEAKILGLIGQNRASSSNFYYYTSRTIYKCWFQLSQFIEIRLEAKLQKQEQILCCSLIEIDSSNTILYGTSEGNLYICNQKQGKVIQIQKQQLGPCETISQKGVKSIQKRKPASICGNDVMIFVGYQKLSSITCFKVSNLSFLKRNRQEIEIDCDNIVKIQSMNINSEQATLCLLIQTCSQQKNTKQKNRIVPILFNYLLHETLNIHTKSPFNKIFDKTVTNKSVLDMNVCLLKKMILVLTADRKIRAYNLQSPETISLFNLFLWQFQFPEETVSFSIHPVNQNIAVAFKDEIKLYSFGFDGLRYMNLSYPQKSQIIRYSKQGHYLTTIYFNSSLMLFNSYSFEIVYVYTCNNLLIKSFQFIGNDEYIVLNGKNGHVAVITIEGKRVIQNYNRTMKVNSCIYDSFYDILVVSYKQNVTKIWTEKGRNEMGIICTSNFYFSCFYISSEYNSLFVGTSKGYIRIYQWPITSFPIFEKSFVQYKLHSTATNMIRLSSNFKHLISSSEDGSVVICKIKHYSNGFGTSEVEINQIFNIQKKESLMSQFQTLIVNSNYQDRSKDEAVLRLESDKLVQKESTDGDMGKLKRQYDRKFLMVESQKRNEKNKISQKYNLEIKLYEYLKRDIEIKREDIDKKCQLTEILKEQFLQKLRKLYEKKQELLAIKQNTQKQCSDEISEHVMENSSTTKFQSQGISSHLSTKRKNYKKTTVSKQYQHKVEQQEAEQHLEEQIIERSELLTKYDDKYQKIKKSSEKLQKQNRFLQSSINVMKERKSKAIILKQNIETKLQILVQQQKSRDECIKNAGIELRKRDEVISQQQQKSKKLLRFNIYQTNQEGSLKHKLQQLQFQCQGKNQELQKLQQQKNKAEHRLVDQAFNRKQFDSSIIEAKKKVDNLKQVGAKQLQKLQYKKYHLHKINNQIQKILYSGQDIKEQLFSIMGTLIVKENQEFNFEHDHCEQKENQRNVFEILLGGSIKYHQETKNLKNNYQHKIRGHATLLTSQYNRLKFQQINLKKALLQLQMDYKQMKEFKERIITNRMKIKQTRTDFFATAVPENETRAKTTAKPKNFRKAKVCKGNILAKKVIIPDLA